MARYFKPCDTDHWSRATFIAQRRLPNEIAREFGNALRQLACRTYPTADYYTHDLLFDIQHILQ